jgi:hypothetical protein
MPSEQQDELLTGREGIEASQGYREMPSATPDVNVDDGPIDEGLRRHIERPNQSEPVERVYQDADGSGRRRDDHETVPVERASDNLAAIRKAERAARDRELDDATSQAVDDLRRQVTGQPPQQPQPAQQPEAQQQQPDPEQLQLQPEQIEAAIAEGVDPEVVEALNKSPKLREAITALDYQASQRVEAFAQHAAAQIEQHKTGLRARPGPECIGRFGCTQCRISRTRRDEPRAGQRRFADDAAGASGAISAACRANHNLGRRLSAPRGGVATAAASADGAAAGAEGAGTGAIQVE